jgi:hypothetical protein
MRRELPAVRIWPMSDKLEGFRGRSIEDVQSTCFLRDLPRMNGRFHYPTVGLAAEPGTIVLFQYRARIIASAVFMRDEKFERPKRGCAGVIYLDPATIRTFDPVDLEGMRNAWPSFRRFGHVRQFLHPQRYAAFKRRLKNVTASASARLVPRCRPARRRCRR